MSAIFIPAMKPPRPNGTSLPSRVCSPWKALRTHLSWLAHWKISFDRLHRRCEFSPPESGRHWPPTLLLHRPTCPPLNSYRGGTRGLDRVLRLALLTTANVSAHR